MSNSNAIDRLVQLTSSAAQWCEQNEEGKTLIPDVRHIEYEALKLRDVINSKMAICTYGASQSGKSFLTSALLSQHAKDDLVLRVGDDEIPFIKCINPAGGGESTGVVTRFVFEDTANQQGRPPTGFPVVVNLLSESDILKILFNSFYNDFPINNTLADDSNKLIAEISKYLTDVPTLGNGVGGTCALTELDIDELKNYVKETMDRTSGDPTWVKALGKTPFWDTAKKAIKGGVDHRVKVFRLLWGDMADGKPNKLTEAYRQLVEKLNAINYQSCVYCSTEVLYTRDNDTGSLARAPLSLVDVQTLRDLGGNKGQSDTEIKDKAGTIYKIALPILAALTRELVLNLKSPANGFQHYTDILDFPGARSREQSNKQKLHEYLLRGKVDYLFQKYVRERALFATMLCVGTLPQEVKSIGPTINRWVEDSHGKDPTDGMARDAESLLIILTKFDETAWTGDKTPDERLPQRIESSIKENLRSCEWIENWDGKHPFRNVFWLTHKNHTPKWIYDERGAIRSAERKQVEELEKYFLENKDVNKYFRDPQKAWNSAVAHDDLGMAYIREALTKLCTPENKSRREQDSIRRLKEKLLSLISNKHRSGTPEDEKAKKVVRALEIGRKMGAVVKFAKHPDFRQTGNLIRHLGASIEIGNHAYEKAKIRQTGKLNQQVDQSEDDPWAHLNDDPSQHLKPDQDEDLSRYFVDELVMLWKESILKERAKQIYHSFQIEEAAIEHLLVEYEEGIKRLGVDKQIAEGFRKRHRDSLGRNPTWIIAPAVDMLNTFIEFRTGEPGGRREARRELSHTELAGLLERTEEQNWADSHSFEWISTLREFIVANADESNMSEEQRQKHKQLGQIIEDIKAI